MAERRLIFVVPGSLDTPTGGYVYDKRMIAELGLQGWQCQLCTLGEGFPDPNDAVLAASYATLSALPRNVPIVIDGLALGALPDIGRALGPDRPLVALVHHPLALETGLPAARATALRDSERAALAASAQVITVSATVAAALTRDYSIAKGRIKVVPPGTDQAPFAKGSADGNVSLLAVGSIMPRKGYPLLIAALTELATLPWRLTIAGDMTRDAAEAVILRRAIDDAGLGSRVRLLGAVSAETLAALYDAADVFVLPSYYEGYGMVFTEALARGLPVIGTLGGAIPEAVPAGTGTLVPPGDAAALTRALRDVIARPDLRAQQAAAARRAAAQLPRWDLSARLFGQAVESAISARPVS